MRATISTASLKIDHNNHPLDPRPQQPLPPPSPPPPRRPRDRNANMRVPPKAPVSLAGQNPRSNSKAGSMPSYDKKSPGSRPPLAPLAPLPAVLTPSAKSPANKTAAARTPLKPRIAGAAQPNSTPLSQRKASTPTNPSRNAISTPVAAFLNNNITPRSGTRKTRVDSTSSTPLGTPIGTPAPPSTNESSRSPADARPHGLGILALGKGTPTLSPYSPSLQSPSLQESNYARSPQGDSKFFYASEATSSPADSKFFFASEAPIKAKVPATQPQLQPARPTLRKKTSNSSFCYASGESVPDLPYTTGSAIGSMVGGDRSHRRLFNTKGITNANSTAASAIGSMVGGERSQHRPFHVHGESYSSLHSPSFHGSMAGSMVGEDRPHHKLFHSDGRPRGSGASAVGSMVGSLVGSMVGSERSHTQFFHANGEPDEPDSPSGSAVGSRVGSTYGEDRPLPKFFHAGDVVPRSSHGSTAGSTVGGEEGAHPKFFHANGTPDAHASSTPRLTAQKTSRASSVVSSSSRMASPRVATGKGGPKSPTQKVPPSTKLDLTASQGQGSVRVKPSLPSPGAPRPLPGRVQSANSMVAPRRASIELAHRVVNHARSISFDSKPEIRTPPTRKYSGASAFDYPSSPLNLITHPVPASTPEEGSEGDASKSDAPFEVTSPLRTGQSIETLNDLAAKARRERKVLDLEITNSSLEAINRTLEREMRKQTAELRRFRRLSRSGRLSIATTIPLRSSSGLVSVMEGEDEPHLADLSENEENSENDESEFSDEEELSEEGSLSPRAMAESDAKHRFKDEKRLQLDLSKHQQLLIDSQKINQSLKRCLGWTEELIIEGQKALEYHVRVSDVALGGRVLALDEVESNVEISDDGGGGVDNEGMSEIGAQMLREARKAAKENAALNSRGGQAKDDRDSGVELDGSQNNDSLSYQS